MKYRIKSECILDSCRRYPGETVELDNERVNMAIAAGVIHPRPVEEKREELPPVEEPKAEDPPESPPDNEPEPQNPLEEMSFQELRQECKARGLPAGGTMKDLIERLCD